MRLAGVLLAVQKDLVRRLRDPLALVLWLGIPLVIGSLVILASGGSGEVPRAHVLIADQDQSFLSEFLVGAMASEQARVFRVEEVAAEEGRARLERGEGSALLVIPEGFGEALLLEEPCRLELVTNPSQRIMPGLVEESLSILSEGAFWAHRLLGSELREIAEGPEDGAAFFADARIAAFSAMINARMRGLERWLFPPVIELEVVEDEADAGGEFSIGTLFFPTMLFMALLFVAQGLSDDVWHERAQGTLRRAVTTPAGAGELFLGKLLAAGVIAGAVTAAGLALGWAAFGFDPGAALAALAWGALAGLVLTAMMTAIQLSASSQRGASLVTNVLLFPLLMLGGAFFPFEAMPDWMAAVGRWTPNGFALVEFKWLLAGGLEPRRLALDLALAAAFGAAFFGYCLSRLGRFARS